MVTRHGGAAVAAVSALALAFTLTACGDDGGSGKPGSDSSKQAESFDCLSGKQLSGSITFDGSDGEKVGGYLTGDGPTGIVLAHQANSDLCQWVVKADELAAAGYRVLAFNSADHEVEEITGAVERLRQGKSGKGVSGVELVGASKGGTAVVEAASTIDPPVDAVVSLSAPDTYGGHLDAATAAPKLTMPVFYGAAAHDSPYADSTRELYKASTHSKDRVLKIYKGSNHGVDLFAAGGAPEAWPDVKAFLKKHAAAG